MKGNTCCTDNEVTIMLQLLMNNIFVEFGRHIFQQNIGIRMGTNCALIIADLFLCLYEAVFMQIPFKEKQITKAKTFILHFRYIDAVLSVNNIDFVFHYHT